ncbi:elongation factor P [bacterium]|nr:elongation factor P [bacterium]
MQIQTSEFKKGLKIEIDNTPFRIVEMSHIQQKRRAVVKVKLRNILTGSIAERTFVSGDRVGKPDIEEKEMEFLYPDGELLYFMDSETYDQIAIDSNLIEDIVPYMKENEQVTVLFYNGQPISAELPQFISVEVKETDPGFKGDTVTTSYKSALLVTGGTVMVPLFLNTGDTIKISTGDFTYVERVKK